MIATPATSTAKTRKRCPGCNRMVEIGETCVARDDTSVKTAQHWIGQGAYRRGAWHLWHPACFAEFVAAIEAAEIRTAADREATLAEMRALAEVAK